MNNYYIVRADKAGRKKMSGEQKGCPNTGHSEQPVR